LRNLLAMRKCQTQCALSPRRAWFRRASFVSTLSKLY
jgi:hypothetical protein